VAGLPADKILKTPRPATLGVLFISLKKPVNGHILSIKANLSKGKGAKLQA
jgi:hypothetical protein